MLKSCVNKLVKTKDALMVGILMGAVGVSNSAYSSGIGSAATSFKSELSEVMGLITYGAYASGAIFAMMGLMKWYEKSQGQHGDQIKNKEIFVKLAVGAALMAFGWTTDTLVGSLAGASKGTATFN
jgi:uncharacterized membrane-anchored protein